MHGLILKFYKNLITKTIYEVAITTSNKWVITLTLVKLGVTKRIATIWYMYHLKTLNVKSLRGQLKRANFVKKILMGKTPVER